MVEEHVEGLCKKASQKVIGKIPKSYFKELLSKDSALTKYFNQMPKPKKSRFAFWKILLTEAATGNVLQEKVLLEISQN